MDNLERLDSLLREFDELSRRSVGYPCNLDFDYTALLPFMRYVANNVGDPFHDSNFQSNTHEIEREVIGIFADLDAHLARRRVGLRHVGRHRGQHVRPLPGAGTLSRRRGLFLAGYPLQRGQDHERAEGAQHHDQEPGQRGDRLRRPPRDDPHQPGRARNRDGEHRHDDEGRDRRRGQDPGHPERPRGHQVIPACGRCAQRHDPAVRGRPAALTGSTPASTACRSAGTRWWVVLCPAASR